MGRARSRTLACSLLLVLTLAACSSGPEDQAGGADPPGGSAFARVAAFCDGSAPTLAAAQPDAGVVQALVALGREATAPGGGSVCDFEGYTPAPGVQAAVAAAMASGNEDDRATAVAAVEARIAEIVANPDRCVPHAWLPCTTELAWLSAQAGALGDAGAVAGAEGGMGDALGGEAEAGSASASDLIDAAATAQQLGLDGLADALIGRARTQAENDVLRLTGETNPCAGDAQDLARMLEAVALVQALGGDSAIADRGLAHATRTAQAMGRNAGAGQGSGAQAEAAMDALGAEDSDDPRCRELWQVHVRYETHAAFGAGASLDTFWDGIARIEVEPGGKAIGKNSATIDVSNTNPPISGCTTSWSLSPIDLTVTAALAGDGSTFEITFEFGTSTISQTTVCPSTSISSPPSASPGPAETITMAAQDGSTYSAPFSVALPQGGTSSGELRVDLTKVAR